MPEVNLAECIRNKTMSLVDMKAFKCHKTVHATPMSQHVAALVITGKVADDDNNPGYLVCYDMGTDKEYVSWSPKEQFENGYSVTDTGIDIMQDEYRELNKKLIGLSDFINHNPIFKNIPFTDKDLMRKQRDAMSEYLMVLGRRITLCRANS